MVNLNNVYNYYSTQILSPRNNQKSNSSHKKDDLKTVYQNMVKQNKDSPLYKFTFSERIQTYAIGIKEAAMALEAESDSLSGDNGNLSEMKAISSNETVAYARLRDDASEELPEDLTLKVNSLAQGQTNVGYYLPSGELSIEPGSYSFGIAVGENEYTFHMNIHSNDTNIEIQRSLASSINDNDIGVRASIRNNRMEGTSALVLRSYDVGKPDNGDVFFTFDETYLENDITSILGVQQIETAPSNAEFLINDNLHTSVSNRISLNHSMDIDLLSTSDEPIHIGYVPDEDKLSDKIEDFLYSYNALVDLAKSDDQHGANRLFHDITNVANRHSEELKAAGVDIDENGHLIRSDDDELFSSTRFQTLFSDKISDFKKDLEKVTGKMTLNPLDYVDKVVVTYPNTSGTYPNPYNPSKYSGLLFNDYR